MQGYLDKQDQLNQVNRITDFMVDTKLVQDGVQVRVSETVELAVRMEVGEVSDSVVVITVGPSAYIARGAELSVTMPSSALSKRPLRGRAQASERESPVGCGGIGAVATGDPAAETS